MKRLLIFVITIIILSFSGLSVFAYDSEPPYENYTYSESDGSVISNPQAYIPSSVIYGTDWQTSLNQPTDIDLDEKGELYILDAGNNRVVVLSKDMSYKREFSCECNDENGELITLNAPKGITVNESYVYICDTANARILIYEKESGELYKKVSAPVSSLLGDDFLFQPVKVAVDAKGNLYIVSNGTYEGIINMRENGEFQGFFSSNKVTSSAWDLFWRRFSSITQRKTMEQLIPQDFSSIEMDKDGFFLITTYTAQKDSMVKKVNQGGVNILTSKSNIPIVGDPVNVSRGSLSGKSSFIDISSGPSKIYACLDRTRGKVFCYNNEGYLLYSFGTLCDQAGGFSSPVAVSYLTDGRIAVLDGENFSLTVFSPTEYARLINEGVEYYNRLEYDESAKVWQKVLELNRNYQLAGDMIGRYHYNSGDFEKAMYYFEQTDNREMYSEAKEALRTAWVYENSWVIVVGILLVLTAFSASGILTIYKKIKKKK